MAKKLINLAKIDFAGNAGAAPGPAPAPSAEADVVLRDYDGSVVASYTKEEFAALTELPAPPEHEGLTFQEWNWPLADAQAYCAQYGMVEFGATYITSDGKTRIYITLTEGRTSPYMSLVVAAGSVDIDWGDNSAIETLSPANPGRVTTQHIYGEAGDYVVTLNPAEGTLISIEGQSPSGCNLLWNNDNAAAPPNRAYQNAIKHIRFGRSVNIGYRAFVGCFSLKTITIPNGATITMEQNFSSCFNLQSIVLPRLTTITNQSFSSCYNLEFCCFPSGLETINTQAFTSCYSLQSVILPVSIRTIHSQAFQNCSKLNRISLAEGLSILEQNVFENCNSLESVTIPGTLKFLNTTDGIYIFYNCLGLKRITFTEGVQNIPQHFCDGCISLNEVEIKGDYPITVRLSAFRGCSSLRKINLPDGYEQLNNSFELCYALSDITPDTGQRVSSSQFGSCFSLTKVTLRRSVTQIMSNGFNNCRNLSVIYALPTIPPTLDSAAFTNVPADCIIYVPAESLQAYKSATNWTSRAAYIQPMPTD